MRSTLLRIVLLRLLPGRLVPILTVWEIARLVRRLQRERRQRQADGERRDQG